MTELIWDGKYDQAGRRVAPLRVALPFQTIETVNESAQQRQHALDLFSAGRDPEWRNRLIWGDKKYVLPSLLGEFAGQVNLIYIDPPFNVGADFSFTATIPSPSGGEGAGDEGESFTKEPSVIEMKAYRDTWGRGLDSYLQWFYETALLLHELLADNGSVYVHLDYHIGHYAKAVLDEVFGNASFMNEIIWHRTSAHSDSSTYGNAHDSLFFYIKSENFTWNKQYQPYDQEYVESHYRYVDSSGRRYRTDNLTAMGLHGKGYTYEWKGVTRVWRCPPETMKDLDAKGRVHYTRNGVAEYIRYLDEMPGVLAQDTWEDISPVNSQAAERVAYATQKPEALLERIVKASSNENDLVLDCFVGSGTTAAVAEKLNRRWIACDLGRFAIHTTRKRLLSIDNVRPFVVQNLGKYERQAWQKAEFGTDVGATLVVAQQAYREFILKLYNARPIASYTWLHGLKGGRMVHVGAVDAPVSTGDVTSIVTEFKRAVGTGKDAPATNGVDVLGWDFAFELNEVAKQQAAQANINVRFMRIPREVLDKKAVEQGDIRFFELAALSVDVVAAGLVPASRKKATTRVAATDARKPATTRDVTLTLTDFVIPPDDVPEEVSRAIKHWSQWIDYWAVDWDNKSDTFHNEWQTYRTRKSGDLQRTVTHTYDAPGEYTVVVKVIDILGNDTTKTLKVEVKG